MEAWKANENIDFNFFDAHDLFISRDTSKPETIKKNLRERMKTLNRLYFLGAAMRREKVVMVTHSLRMK
jgi:hypothetical protein